MKKMKKKILLCSLVGSMLFTLPVFAETRCEEPEFLNDGYVSIEGTTDVDVPVAFKAARVGESVEYVAIKETVSDDEGNFTILFRIPEEIKGASSNGEYKVSIVAQNEAKKEISFEYISFEYIFKKIKTAQSGDALYDIISKCTEEDKDALVMMGIAVEELDEVISKLGDITDEWFNICDLENADVREVAESCNKAIGLEYAKKGDIETALEIINPSYDGVAYNSAENKTKLAQVMESSMDDESVEKFNASYVLSNKIIEFREMRAAALVDAIEEYDEYFEFSDSGKYDTYTGMTLTKKGKVADKLSQLIDSDTVTVSEIINAFETAVKSVTNTGSTGSLSSGGGGGGGRGTATGSYSSGATDSEYQVEMTDTQTGGFSDLDGVEWAAEAISALADKGVVSGSGDGRFNPNNSVTREEFTKMVVLACGIYNSSAECDFADVSKNEWYYRYIASAVERGIIKGIGDDAFGTGSKITREDMAVIVKRAAEAAGISFTQTKPAAEFADGYMIADYAKDSIEELYCAGIINGVGGGAFAPTESSTRAQAAKIIYEAFAK